MGITQSGDVLWYHGVCGHVPAGEPGGRHFRILLLHPQTARLVLAIVVRGRWICIYKRLLLLAMGYVLLL